jgi:superfamily II DNA or RNA helicase
MMLKLRDYQTKAIRAIHEKWDAGVQRPAVVLPTGAGKTVVFAHLIEEYLTANPDKRVIVLAHTDELVRQAVAKIHAVMPGRMVGIVKAAQNDVHAQVIVASVQSLRSIMRMAKIRNVGLIVVDECHHAVAKTYQAILCHFGALPPKDAGDDWTPACHAIGFTATLVRADKEKLSDVWEDVAFRLSIAFMIRQGYLLDVRGKRVEVPDLHLENVRQSGGDYQEGALGEALVEAMAPEIVTKAFVEHASDRQGLIFAPTVDSAYAFADAFNEAGIKTEVVHGALARDERRAVLARLADGTTQCVSNCMVLTEGFDNPKVSVAVIARPTKSAGLYQQMVGRVLRPDLTLPPAERGHARILDVVGISRRHDLRSLIDLSDRDDVSPEDAEDLSLLELEDLIVEEPEPEGGAGGGFMPEPMYYGPAETRDFDPLSRDSKRTWATTPDGHYYLRSGDIGYVFLVDSIEGDPGTFDVVWCMKTPPGQVKAGMTEHRGLGFEMAIAWAEEEALERGGYGTLTLSHLWSGMASAARGGSRGGGGRVRGRPVLCRWRAFDQGARVGPH